jgi:O-methyltransferase
MNKQKDPRELVAEAYGMIRKQEPWTYPGQDFLHHRILPRATLSPWLNDSGFLNLFAAVEAHTLVDIYRCWELYSLAKQMQRLSGVYVEVGVWRGGTGAVLASAAPGKKVYLADTFRGVVKAGKNDPRYRGGEHADTSRLVVESLMQDLSLNNTEVIEGVFPEDTLHLVPKNISLLHIDVDVYESCVDIVRECKQFMCRGGAIVFDDYGFFGCEGVTKYCDMLRQDTDFLFIHNLNGHAIFIKL